MCCIVICTNLSGFVWYIQLTLCAYIDVYKNYHLLKQLFVKIVTIRVDMRCHVSAVTTQMWHVMCLMRQHRYEVSRVVCDTTDVTYHVFYVTTQMCMRLSNLSQLKIIIPVLFKRLDDSWLTLIGCDVMSNQNETQTSSDSKVLLAYIDASINALVNFIAYRVQYYFCISLMEMFK